MTRRLTALFFLLAVAGCTFDQVVALTDYYINQHYIAKNLCEKREVAGSCCKGKCFLKKQLQKTEKADRNAPSKERTAFLFYCELHSGYLYFPACSFTGRPPFVLKKYLALRRGIFHPPGVHGC